MKIKNLKVDRFRNLTKVNVSFWNINILTWKNSSWKTNFTHLLSNCLNLDPDLWKDNYLWKNIVTNWKWYKDTNIEVEIDNIKTISISRWLNWWQDLWIMPEKFIFKNKLSKKYLSSIKQSVIFYWKSETINFDNGDFSTVKWFLQKSKTKEISIFNKNFHKEIITNENINYVNDYKSETVGYFSMFKNQIKDAIINYSNYNSFSSEAIYNFVIEKYQIETNESLIKELNNKNKKPPFSLFKNSKFHYLLVDIQKNKKQREKFYNDLDFYTNWIIKKVYINTKAINWPKWDIFIETPNAPKDIEYISAWSSVILFFILLKNWLELPFLEKSYREPEIMIFDELDCVIHPSLLSLFAELLNIISTKVQLFITTHSPKFINEFEKNQIYLLKDLWSIWTKYTPISNILSYEDIISKLDDEESKKYFIEKEPSELFIEWLIDDIFPIN